MGRKAKDVVDVTCGITCSLVGVDEAILKQGTISTSAQAHAIRSMKDSVSSVVRVAVNAKNPANLPKLVSGLIKMSKADPLIQVINTETEHIKEKLNYKNKQNWENKKKKEKILPQNIK